MGMMKRIRDKTTAPPFVPGSRKTGRLLELSFFSDILSDDDDADFVLLPFSMKGLAVKGESCLTLLVTEWTLLEDGVKAAASCPRMMAAIAQMQRVKKLFIDLAMVMD